MPAELLAYADEMAEAAVGASQTFVSSAYTNISTSTPMPVKAPAGLNLGAFEIFAAVVLTASASQAASSNTDILDEWLVGYEVGGGIGGATRLKTLSRGGAVTAERVMIQPAAAGTAYNATTNPFVYGTVGTGDLSRGQAPATFTASGSRTDNSFLIVPASGGQACYTRLMYTNATNTYAASVTSSTTFTLYAFATIVEGVSAVQELQSDAINAQTLDLAVKSQPDDMSPLGVVLVGATFGTNGISRIQLSLQGEGQLWTDFEDVAVGAANQALFPRTYKCQDTGSTTIWLYRKRARSLKVTTQGSWSNTAFKLLYFDIQNVPTAGGTTSPASTPTPAATQRTATVAAGGQVVSTNAAGAGVSHGNPGRSGGASISHLPSA